MTECYDEEGNPIPHRARSGMLDRPEFGELTPMFSQARKRPIMEVRYKERHIDVIREHPGVWAKVAVFKIGSGSSPAMTKKQSWEKSRAEKQRLIEYVRKAWPLENWKVSCRTTPDTWGDREVWMMFVGHWTEEERLAAREAGRAKLRWRMDLAQKRRAEKEAVAKAQILQMQKQRGGR